MNTATATATGTVWALDAAHTNVEFAVKHLMISTVRGRFADVSGTVQLGDQDPAASSVEVTIKVASLDTRQEDRDAHLRSADFFDADNFPILTFKSTRVARDGKDILVDGDLSIRGVTRPVTLRATEEGRARDPWGGERVAFTAATKINRRDFGLTWNQALETGGFVVGDEVKITIDTELVKQ
jgi:polyisoprenoid-binding protein YceI